MGEQETIVAILTPVGRGGIGIVRLSGPEARAIAAGMVRLRGEWAAGRVRFAEVLDVGDPTHAAMGLRHEWGAVEAGASENKRRFPSGMTSGAVLDEAVVTWFQAPHS
jgi:tRNA modification GTPase